jgi:hypothetical protein
MPNRYLRTRAMNPETGTVDVATAPTDTTSQCHDLWIERLIDRLSNSMRSTIRWLRRPSSRWVRVPIGVLFIGGSFLAILPFFGLWMLPLGLMLLAEDVPPLQRGRDRILDYLERHRPHWFTGKDAESRT